MRRVEKKFKADSDTMQEKNRLAIPVYVGHEEKNNWIEAKNGPWDGVLVFFFVFCFLVFASRLLKYSLRF